MSGCFMKVELADLLILSMRDSGEREAPGFGSEHLKR